jgi:hypothetical protein
MRRAEADEGASQSSELVARKKYDARAKPFIGAKSFIGQ